VRRAGPDRSAPGGPGLCPHAPALEITCCLSPAATVAGVRLDELAVYEALMVPGDPLDRLLEAVRSRPPWMARGACREHPVELFFPAAPARGVAPDEGPALAICAGCPVSYQCREFAEEHGEAGVWGGTTARQRRARSAA
jgi:WhiB family redox-sensing transcriptional regulator